MITPSYVRTMAAYNAVMNEDIYAAAAELGDAERRRDRGAFWRSIHGTLNHLIWADHRWMSRFAGWENPAVPIKDSGGWYQDFDAMAGARRQTDDAITAWAVGMTEDWLAQDLHWVSNVTGGAQTKPRAFLVAHMFNHQTHHRGQVHAMLTAAGIPSGVTDLAMLVEPAV